MERNKNYQKIIAANVIKIISIFIITYCGLEVIVAIMENKVYRLSFHTFILMFATIAVYCIMELWRKWIILEKCDIQAQEMYIKSLLKRKMYRESVILHMELLGDSLLLGKYDQVRQEIEELRRLDSRLKPEQRLVIQLYNIDYLIAIDKIKSLDTELEKAENLLVSLNGIRDRKKQEYQRRINLRQYLVEERWEDVLRLLNTEKVMTIIEQIRNAYYCGKCCCRLGRYEEGFCKLKFVAEYGGNTGYVKFANEIIEQIPEKNLLENRKTEQSIKTKQGIDKTVIILAVSCLLTIMAIVINYYCSHGNSVEEAYCRRFWCSQDELTVIYQKNIGKYELVIFREGEKDAYCLLEATGSAFKMVDAFRFVRRQTEPIGVELPEDAKVFFQESNIEWEIYVVIKGFYKKNNIFFQEDMAYVGICSFQEAENVVVNGNPVSIEQVIYIDDAVVYLWSVENVDLNTNIHVEYVAK